MHAADLAAQHLAVKKMCPTLSPALVDRAVRALNVDFSCFGPAHAVRLNSFPSEGALRDLELSRGEVYEELYRIDLKLSWYIDQRVK